MADASQRQGESRSVLELIYDWSEEQSLWKRDALRRIIQNTDVTEGDISELVTILEYEHSESAKSGAASVLEKSSLPNRPKGGDDVRIVSISNVSNVNRLASHQALEFGQTGMTVVFGNNGSGKSGYTRILKSACTARHRSKILPNIYDQSSMHSETSATISYQVGDNAVRSVGWGNSEYPHEELSAISVFDKECSKIHIGNENEVSVPFRPLGLDIPEKLVDVYKRVESALKEKRDALNGSQNAIFRNPVWKETTPIGKIISGLSKSSNTDEFRENADFSEDDVARLKTLRELLATDPLKQINELRNKSAAIDRLKRRIEKLETQFSTENWSDLKLSLDRFSATQKAAKIASEKPSETDLLKNIATSEWKVLWEAAREFSTKKVYQEKEFPNVDVEAVCVLCQQHLEDKAKTRLISFEAYVKSETEEKLREAEQEIKIIRNKNASTTVRLSDVRDEIEILKIYSKGAYLKTIRHLATIRSRKSSFRRMVDCYSDDIPIFDLTGDCEFEIQKVKSSIEKSIIELKEASTEVGWGKLLAEMDSLNDKQWANQNLGVVSEEIDRLKSLDCIERCLKDTNSTAVTNLGNKLADEAITPQLRDNFFKEIMGLVGDKLRVETARTRGRAGAPKYKVQLVRRPKESVPEILSEGEQTCVGIASFFAELATSEHNSALVFDDPISSLDHRWRTRAAERLAEEARCRQVVVFTHDLIFLNDLEEAAKRREIPFSSKHIKATPEQSGFVDDNLPWDGMKIAARIDALGKEARRIQANRAKLDDETYKTDARGFYSNLRASWERALEEVALSDTVMRHRDYIKSKNVRKLAALDRKICSDWSRNFGRCCDFTESHDTSRGRAQELPEPKILFDDIKELKEWVDELKEAHKEIDRQS